MINKYDGYLKTEYLTGTAFVILALVLGMSITEFSTKAVIFLIVAIAGAGISAYKPTIPLFLFFGLLPMQLVTVLPSQSLTKFIGIYLVGLIVMQSALTKKISLPFSSKSLWIVIYVFIAICSLSISDDISVSKKYLITLIFLIIMYFLLYSMIKHAKTLNWAVLSLMLGGVLSIIFNFALGIGGIRSSYSIGGFRRSGLVGDPNNFAAIMLVMLPISFLIFLRAKSFLTKTLTLGFFAILLIGFFNTYSRGGFLAFSVMGMVGIFKFNMLEKRSNKVKTLVYIILIAIMGIVIFYPMSQTYLERVETLQSLGSADQDSSLRNRFEYLKKGLNVFLDNPILGVGLRNFKSLNESGQVVHNMYLEVLTGLGLLGFIPFMAILYLTWRDLVRVQMYWKIRDEESSFVYQLAIALQLGFLGYLVAALFLSLDNRPMTWLLITLSSVLWGISSKKEPIYRNEKSSAYANRYTALGRS